jgi:hypothetical protein
MSLPLNVDASIDSVDCVDGVDGIDTKACVDRYGFCIVMKNAVPNYTAEKNDRIILKIKIPQD